MGEPLTAAPGLRGASLSDELVSAIEHQILFGEIPVGTWLRHGAIAEQFGVSRTPVREALRILQARGIVEIERNRGARVRGPSPRDLRDLGDVRAELEGYAAELAAERIRDGQLRRLLNAWRGYHDGVTTFVRRPDSPRGRAAGERWVRANTEFHAIVQEAAGNPQLRASIEDLHRRLPRNITYSALSGDSRLLLDNVAQHEAIADAIARREPAAARAAMERHVRSSAELVARWFESQLDDSRAS
ncbi:GntR family transcriptional regulator [Conexibacter sp. CPCC 206217]|uniref:GntR family transcriptional regulator n=1 Tax=Conexibacter sp. CPCC 206217 TaxID=3064574 RepID=UPI0027215EAF|nr:GntR family transcriptional regulator [Conexibacter sp. CPCC 206217]MDO8213617.1 GntR family transcriptional regulator [Conexibacter sp. CPCC 206217]